MTVIEKARRDLILIPANDPKKDDAWLNLYVKVLGPPPPGSVPLPVVWA